jgi:TPR repeat protein
LVTGSYQDGLTKFKAVQEHRSPIRLRRTRVRPERLTKKQIRLSSLRTKQDLVDAVKQYRHEAKEGSAEAQYLLGCCYQFGDGIAKNKDEAAKWFRKSVKQGYILAQELLEAIKLRSKSRKTKS